jgi:hypothetical protein
MASGPPFGAAPSEELLGALLDHAHRTPPRQLAALIAGHAAASGLAGVTIYLQDYDQQVLVPLPVSGRSTPAPERIDTGLPGRVFSSDTVAEHPAENGTRMWLPLRDGTTRLGVLALSLPEPSDRTRTVARRLAGLVADLLIVKADYSDYFFQTRRRQPMSIAAEMQWQLLPPLTMTTSRVAVAGLLQPAYEVGGDVFDHALNDDTLHVAIMDAVGHGLGAAILSAAVVGAYRHARRAGTSLEETYTGMNDVVASHFDDEQFATAHLAQLDVVTGVMRWVNAGHPRPLLIRDRRVIGSLRSRTTLPVGLGGHDVQVAEEQLQPGDRLLLFTDGVIEERSTEGQAFGIGRLRQHIDRIEADRLPVQESVRRLATDLLGQRGGTTADDATLLMLEWAGDPS